MTRRAYLLTAAAAVFVCSGAVAEAGGITTVFDNPWTSLGGNCSFNMACAAEFGLGDVFAAQAFSLATAQTVTAASFTEWDLGDQPFAANWMIYQADGSGGLPGTEVASGKSSNGLFSQYLGFVDGYDIHQENFNFSSGTTLQPGDYYFAVQAVAHYEPIYLSTASQPGTAETFDGGATWTKGYAGFDMIPSGIAVGLYNGKFSGIPNPANPVPEPAAWALLLIGFAGIARLGRRGQVPWRSGWRAGSPKGGKLSLQQAEGSGAGLQPARFE